MTDTMLDAAVRGEALVDHADDQFHELMKREGIDADDWWFDGYDDSVEVICADEANAMKLKDIGRRLFPEIGCIRMWIHVGPKESKREIAYLGSQVSASPTNNNPACGSDRADGDQQTAEST